MDKQRTDTTMFMSNIKKAGRMSLAHDVLIEVVKAIPELFRPISLSKVLEYGFKTMYSIVRNRKTVIVKCPYCWNSAFKRKRY